MSIKREVTTAFDVDTLEKAAKELGYKTARNVAVRGYGSSIIEDEADLVIEVGGGYDVGIKNSSDGTSTMIMDEHGGYVKSALKDILTKYVELKIKNKFNVKKKVCEDDEVLIYMER